MQNPHVYALSNNSLLLDASHLSTSGTLSIQKKIWSLANHCKKDNSFIDIVPGMNSLTLYLKHDIELAKWLEQLPAIWNNIKPNEFVAKHHKIKTHYNGADLNYVANFHSLSIDDVINLHSEPQYAVLFLGFQPGFAYLNGLNKQLFTPRRSEPRLKVPRGSVAIGADQTAIYPADSPGGWHIIGQTDIPLFDATQKSPCLIQPGDTLEFIPGSVGK
ncbi:MULTISPECIES: 5-oxoprolinase subunit PxpB [Pseudoalteromonas]|uniref:5-oxoprolinase subunit PxpB n=1 Tax=Pseudoalteromonas TaxID=53246 RepID=UPI001FB1AA2D|nr:MULTISPECIES: 5-oxoprolinase subunit PxpB [Pseudoalteromonas]UOB75000.1 5-oxoprolinase subunit PxpB [Pseudoalteromonas sp. APM04]